MKETSTSAVVANSVRRASSSSDGGWCSPASHDVRGGRVVRFSPEIEFLLKKRCDYNNNNSTSSNAQRRLFDHTNEVETDTSLCASSTNSNANVILNSFPRFNRDTKDKGAAKAASANINIWETPTTSKHDEQITSTSTSTTTTTTGDVTPTSSNTSRRITLQQIKQQQPPSCPSNITNLLDYWDDKLLPLSIHVRTRPKVFIRTHTRRRRIRSNELGDNNVNSTVQDTSSFLRSGRTKNDENATETTTFPRVESGTAEVVVSSSAKIPSTAPDVKSKDADERTQVSPPSSPSLQVDKDEDEEITGVLSSTEDLTCSLPSLEEGKKEEKDDVDNKCTPSLVNPNCHVERKKEESLRCSIILQNEDAVVVDETAPSSSDIQHVASPIKDCATVPSTGDDDDSACNTNVTFTDEPSYTTSRDCGGMSLASETSGWVVTQILSCPKAFEEDDEEENGENIDTTTFVTNECSNTTNTSNIGGGNTMFKGKPSTSTSSQTKGYDSLLSKAKSEIIKRKQQDHQEKKKGLVPLLELDAHTPQTSKRKSSSSSSSSSSRSSYHFCGSSTTGGGVDESSVTLSFETSNHKVKNVFDSPSMHNNKNIVHMVIAQY